MRSPLTFLFSRLNNLTSLSFSSQDRCSSPHHCHGLLWTLSKSLSYVEDFRAGDSGGRGLQWALTEQRGRITSWPCFFWCSPGRAWLSGLQVHIASSRPIFQQAGSPSLSPWGCPQPTHSAILILGIAPAHAQDLALDLAELYEVHIDPLLKPAPLDDIPSLRWISCSFLLSANFLNVLVWLK